jgi:origin recognition complex subunit 4
MRNFDEAFEDPSPGSNGAAVSRETFLSNEALKRQREARNFVYRGDASAPKLTRSGKVIGVQDEEGDMDEYGEAVNDKEEGMEVGLPSPADEDIQEDGLRTTPSKEVETFAKQSLFRPLPAGARPHVLRILYTLTSQNIGSFPAPCVDEESNDALQGLLTLLKGTVERGEGNSALVVGPRGVGKTRVSSALFQTECKWGKGLTKR